MLGKEDAKSKSGKQALGSWDHAGLRPLPPDSGSSAPFGLAAHSVNRQQAFMVLCSWHQFTKAALQ